MGSDERIAFMSETKPGHHCRVIVSGDIDLFLLEALENFLKRQRKLLSIERKATQ